MFGHTLRLDLETPAWRAHQRPVRRPPTPKHMAVSNHQRPWKHTTAPSNQDTTHKEFNRLIELAGNRSIWRDEVRSMRGTP